MFHRRIDEFVNLGKGHNAIELADNLCLVHAEDCAVEKDILASGQFRMKAGSNFQKA